MCRDRTLVGDVKTVTIKRDALYDLYLCFSVEVDDPKVRPTSGKMAGFDFGLKSFLTVHDGFESYEIASPELFKQSLKSVKALSRCLSRKAEGSNNRRKARARLARAHRAIANKRLDWFFKLSHDLTERYDYLFFETLNLKGMQRL